MQVSDHTERADAEPSTIALDTRKAASRVLDAARASSGVELFGSFLLGGAEFALPASCIREVVNFPDRMIPVPLAPHFLEGVFTLRGHVIPVLNLARIFDAAAPVASPAHKIAIIDHDQVQVGILFHGTGEVLRVRPEQRSMMQYSEGGTAGVIAGTILLDEGARLLQILDPNALVHIENVPQVQALRSAAHVVDKSHFQQQAQRRKCLSFHVGGTAFAFEMSAIREIIMVPELKASVMASALCLGRINFRGHPVAVIDFAALLQCPASTAPDPVARRILVAIIGEELVGFLVDSVDSIFSFLDSEVLAIPLLSKARASMFAGCISHPGQDDFLFLDHEGIFSHAELREISAGHVRLYQEEAQSCAATRVNARVRREAYIVFSLDTPWAVEIKQLHEIVSDSAGLVRPPGLPPFVHGVLNLRRQMISVIDLRTLYGMPARATGAPASILIIARGEERFGLLVDSVDNILSVAATERRSSPRLGNPAHGGANREVIDTTGADGQTQTLYVFDPLHFFARVDRAVPVAA